jgi:hypothetical protein
MAVLFLSSPVLRAADYQVLLRGGASYRTHRKPAEKNGAYVFTATDGTFLSVRKKDVASVRPVTEPAPAITLPDVEETSPVAAARNQQRLAKKIHENGRGSSETPQSNVAYRPGVGVPLPAGSNDYVVGKTWAAPPSGTVYTGSAPKGAPSGDAPKGAPSMDAPKGAPAVDAVPPSPPPPATAPPPPPPS